MRARAIIGTPSGTAGLSRMTSACCGVSEPSERASSSSQNMRFDAPAQVGASLGAESPIMRWARRAGSRILVGAARPLGRRRARAARRRSACRRAGRTRSRTAPVVWYRPSQWPASCATTYAMWSVPQRARSTGSCAAAGELARPKFPSVTTAPPFTRARDAGRARDRAVDPDDLEPVSPSRDGPASSTRKRWIDGLCAVGQREELRERIAGAGRVVVHRRVLAARPLRHVVEGHASRGRGPGDSRAAVATPWNRRSMSGSRAAPAGRRSGRTRRGTRRGRAAPVRRDRAGAGEDVHVVAARARAAVQPGAPRTRGRSR